MSVLPAALDWIEMVPEENPCQYSFNVVILTDADGNERNALVLE